MSPWVLSTAAVLGVTVASAIVFTAVVFLVRHSGRRRRATLVLFEDLVTATPAERQAAELRSQARKWRASAALADPSAAGLLYAQAAEFEEQARQILRDDDDGA